MGTEKKAAAEVQENQTEQAAAQVQAPVAYCGPTIKGIAHSTRFSWMACPTS